MEIHLKDEECKSVFESLLHPSIEAGKQQENYLSGSLDIQKNI